MFSTMYPNKFLHSPSWADHVALVGFKADFFKAPNFVKCFGNAEWNCRTGELYCNLHLSLLLCEGVYILLLVTIRRVV